MGKTVTVAYAAFDPSPTRNPWNPDRTPGGSSSGSAAAVACGMCLGALGTQTGGSITRPASYCGVYGLKPTYGGVSLEGVVPFAPSFDHGGMIGGSVRDLALPDPADPAGPRDAPAARPTTRPTIGKPVRKSLGLPGGFFDTQAEPAMAAAFGRLVEQLRAQGLGRSSRSRCRRPWPTSRGTTGSSCRSRGWPSTASAGSATRTTTRRS